MHHENIEEETLVWPEGKMINYLPPSQARLQSHTRRTMSHSTLQRALSPVAAAKLYETRKPDV